MAVDVVSRDIPSMHMMDFLSMGMCITNEVCVMVHNCKSSGRSDLLCSKIGVMELSVHNCVVRSHLPLALGGAVVTRTIEGVYSKVSVTPPPSIQAFAWVIPSSWRA